VKRNERPRQMPRGARNKTWEHLVSKGFPLGKSTFDKLCSPAISQGPPVPTGGRDRSTILTRPKNGPRRAPGHRRRKRRNPSSARVAMTPPRTLTAQVRFTTGKRRALDDWIRAQRADDPAGGDPRSHQPPRRRRPRWLGPPSAEGISVNKPRPPPSENEARTVGRRGPQETDHLGRRSHISYRKSLLAP
jgi:hypothetical protein